MSQAASLVSCPACKGHHAEVQKELSAAEVARRYFNPKYQARQYETLSRHIAGLWSRDRAEIRLCEQCGLRFSWPFVSGDAFFYNLATPNTAYPQHKWEFDVTLADLKGQSGSEHGSVLEFGAGDGAFLRRLVGEGWDRSRLTGLEFSTSGYDRMRAEGFDAHMCAIADFETDRKFDVVCLFQVLEHLSDLDRTMDGINGLTHARSSVYIAVPNHRWAEVNEAIGLTDDYPPNHISRWKEPSLAALARRHGWAVSKSDRDQVDRILSLKYTLGEKFSQNAANSTGFHGWIESRIDGGEGGASRKAIKGLLSLTQPSAISLALRRYSNPDPFNLWVRLDRIER